MRQAVAITLAALAVLIAVRLWFVDGLLRTVRIEGPSMASAFDGAHYAVVCDDCRFPFRCDAHDVPASGEVVCPNCGYRRNSLENAALAAGERVLIDRWPHIWRGPGRGDIVAAQEPGSTDELVMKRIAALPGESLAIRDGDLYVDEQIARKTPAQWRELRVLVHDNRFQPQRTQGLPARWQAAQAQSGWKPAGEGFEHVPADGALSDKIESEGDTGDWLAFQPWRCSDQRSRTQVVPVFDNDGYNQGLNRNLNAVPDVGVSCELAAADNRHFRFALMDGTLRFEVLFEPAESEIRLLQNGQPVAYVEADLHFDRRRVTIEFALCDRQVFVIVGGRTMVRHAYERPAGQTVEVAQPLMIAAEGAVKVSDLRVWRDIYYLDPQGGNRPWQAERSLAADAFALLGDNPPVSIDSRHWPAAGIQRHNVLGRVQQPFWTSWP